MMLSIALLLLFLLLSAFFSGMEMAFISSSKLKVELSKNQGKKEGKALSYFMKNPSRFIGTYLIGNNIALVLYGLVLGRLLSPLWQQYFPQNQLVSMLLETIIGTTIVLIFGEFLPKLIFRLRANKLLHFFAIPFTAFHILLFLPVVFVNWLTKGLMRLFFGLKLDEDEPVFTEVDLEHYIKETMHGSDDEDIDAELLENALELRDVKVRECMVPRPEITAIDVNESIEKLKETIIESGFSKIVIYEENIDNVLGYVHHFDLHKKPATITQMIKKIPVVPETMLAQSLLGEFKKQSKSMALVVDEYGGTAGIVAFEDILEEIFGEIKDEHDEEDYIEQQLSKTEYLFSGRLEIDYLNEEYDVDLPESDDYETLSGFLIHLTENIPEREDVVQTDTHEFTILNVSNTKVETVKLRRKN